MWMGGPRMIKAVLENLKTEDLELLLARRGLPSCSHDTPLHEALVDRLHTALSDELCRFEWEVGQVPQFHCGALHLLHACG